MCAEAGKERSLEEQLVENLCRMNYKVVTAESCTGGLVSGTIINVPGASDVLGESYITYSNEAKHRLLGVAWETLDTVGAVSPETAAQMAEGAAEAARADVGISTTGIAGPGGGTAEKPVGLVYIGCCVHGKTEVKECRFQGNRMENRMHTVEEALKLAIKMLPDRER